MCASGQVGDTTCICLHYLTINMYYIIESQMFYFLSYDFKNKHNHQKQHILLYLNIYYNVIH